MLVETVHFRRAWSDPYSIGWKAAAVNLSDLAAMGAQPRYAFLSLALTTHDTVEIVDRMYDGFADCLNRYGARLAGGDTNAAPTELVLNATLVGTVPTGRALLRSAARPGDVILVTGTLGDSSIAFALLTAHGVARSERVSKDLINSHRRPQPRIVAGRAARETGKVHAAMDISDGLLSDIQKLCAASNVGARIQAGQLPISRDARQASIMMNRDPVRVALEGGEDFELLLTVPPADVEEVTEAITSAGANVTPIGEITKAAFRVIAPDGQTQWPTDAAGWDHFSS